MIPFCLIPLKNVGSHVPDYMLPHCKEHDGDTPRHEKLNHTEHSLHKINNNKRKYSGRVTMLPIKQHVVSFGKMGCSRTIQYLDQHRTC